MNPQCSCPCCSHSHSVTRREFLWRVGTVAAGAVALQALDGLAADAGPQRPPRQRKTLKVQPVLTYATPKRREETSWRSWGGIQTDADAEREKARINTELAKLKQQADFPVEFLPLVAGKSGDEAAKAVGNAEFDVMLLYAAGGSALEKLVKLGQHNLMFLRHQSGPVYLWYEIVHPRFLRKTVDDYAPSGMDVWDVVVDKYDELLGRLRALSGLKNTLGKRIVAIGGPGGWGTGGRQAPGIARELWKMEIVDYPYKDLAPRLEAAYQNAALVKRCTDEARRYLRQWGVSMHTKLEFFDRAFVLTEVFKDILDEAKTDAITVHHCMGTIMGISKTTACMPLSLLNDDNYLAFCESDFVVIPSGILLHYISGLPVFLNDPTFPHDGIVTLAHCTAPRKMDGRRPERVKVLTHFESDYGAAPKVEMRLGQICTVLVPDFASKKWVGFRGSIVGNPFLDICRSQVDVKIHGDWAELLEKMKGFHWMLSYGDYLKEVGYALKKVGVELLNVSEKKTA